MGMFDNPHGTLPELKQSDPETPPMLEQQQPDPGTLPTLKQQDPERRMTVSGGRTEDNS